MKICHTSFCLYPGRHRTVKDKKEEDVSSSTLNSKDFKIYGVNKQSIFCSTTSYSSPIRGALGTIFSQLLKDYCIKENFSPEKIGLSVLWYIRKKSQNKYNIWKRNNRKYSLWDKTVSLKIHFSWNNFLIFFAKYKLARRIQANNIIKMKTEIISKYVKFVPEEWENQLSCDVKKKN